MNKIGCVIAYRKGHTNYGTALVGYALLKNIQKLGYECEIINYIKKLSIKDIIRFITNAVLSGETNDLVNRVTKPIFKKFHPKYSINIDKRVAMVESYKINKLIPYFHNYIGYDDIHRGSENYDVILVGSDQVWHPLSLPNKFFNLLFVKDGIRKVSYSSSFGVSSIPKFQHKATSEYLNRFYKIGVRELSGKQIVETLSNNHAEVVADPTLLLSRKEWEKEFENIIPKKDKYILCYFLGTNIEARHASILLSQLTKFRIVAIPHMDNYFAFDDHFGDERIYDAGPNEFLRLINDAEYVCTDSFHCTAFCIQFHKQFMTFYRFRQNASRSRNSRIDSLFSTLGINKERIYDSLENNKDITKIFNSVDWQSIDKNIIQLRQKSISFLSSELNTQQNENIY